MQVNACLACAVIGVSPRSWSKDLSCPLNAGGRLKGARRGLASSPRFAQALTPVPLRLAKWSGSPALCGVSLMEANMPTSLISDDTILRLLANGARSAAGEDIDPVPLVKLFTPAANATWLLTETDPEAPDIAFGLCDLGLGCPELGSVSLEEIMSVRGSLGLSIERDLYYRETRPLSVLAKLALQARRIG